MIYQSLVMMMMMIMIIIIVFTGSLQSETILSISHVLIINSSRQHKMLGDVLSLLYRGRCIFHFTSRDLHSSEDIAENKTNICLQLDLFPWDS